jgi:hypothetical protein
MPVKTTEIFDKLFLVDVVFCKLSETGREKLLNGEGFRGLSKTEDVFGV